MNCFGLIQTKLAGYGQVLLQLMVTCCWFLMENQYQLQRKVRAQSQYDPSISYIHNSVTSQFFFLVFYKKTHGNTSKNIAKVHTVGILIHCMVQMGSTEPPLVATLLHPSTISWIDYHCDLPHTLLHARLPPLGPWHTDRTHGCLWGQALEGDGLVMVEWGACWISLGSSPCWRPWAGALVNL